MQARETSFKIVINGKDATKDLSPYILSFNYVDNKTDKADELSVDLDNSDFRFLNDWFISSGMVIEAWIGQMYCGKFTVDQPEEFGPPHTACFRAQSALFNTPMRVPRSFVHENKTLEQIVKKYAGDHNLKVVGTIPELNLKHFVQLNETDIEFLHRVADRYGCHCSVKGDTLLFDAIENQWKNEVCKTIAQKDVMTYRFTTSQSDAPDGAVVKYNDVHGDEVIEDGVIDGTVDTDSTKNIDSLGVKGDLFDLAHVDHSFLDLEYGSYYLKKDKEVNPPSNVAVVKHMKVESKEEAKQVAKGIVQKGKVRKHRFMVKVPGDELLVAGQNVKGEEFGKRSGFWAIDKSTHSFGRNGTGYTTAIEGAILANASGGKRVPTRKKHVPQVNAGKGGNYIDDVNGGKHYGFGSTFMHGK